LEQIKSGLWPTHLFRQITGVVTAHPYDGTKSFATVIIHPVFLEFNGRKSSGGGKVLLQGVLAIVEVFTMVNRGEIVVNCMVNVDSGTPLLWGPNEGHDFEVYFRGGREEASDGFQLGWWGLSCLSK
jgi:hypothetical protein